jgi:hypothetical protein
MTAQLDLKQTVTQQYLTHEKIESLFDQMGVKLKYHHLTSNGYQALLQVIAWAIIEKLKASNSFPASELTENNVKPIVDSAIKSLCTIIPPDPGFPDVMPPGLLSRIIWWCGQELQL